MTQASQRTNTIISWTVLIVVTLVVSGLFLYGQYYQPPPQINPIPPTFTPAPAADRPGTVPTPLPPVETVLAMQPSPTPLPDDPRPARVQISAAGIDEAVYIVYTNYLGQIDTPEYVAGFWYSSAPLNEDGRIVIVGHNKAKPLPIFQTLGNVEVGDLVVITDQYIREYRYRVTEIQTFPVEPSVSQDIPNTLEWFQPTDTRELVLATCQPVEACTGVLIVRAVPEAE